MNEQLPKESRVRHAVVLGCVSALAAGLFGDFGMAGACMACIFITAGCFVFCAAEWESGK